MLSLGLFVVILSLYYDHVDSFFNSFKLVKSNGFNTRFFMSMRKSSSSNEKKVLSQLLEYQLVKISCDTVAEYMREIDDNQSRRWLLYYQNLHDVNTVGILPFFRYLANGQMIPRSTEIKTGFEEAEREFKFDSFKDEVNFKRVALLIARTMKLIRDEIVLDMKQIKKENGESIRVATIWMQDGEKAANKSRRPMIGTQLEPLSYEDEEAMLQAMLVQSQSDSSSTIMKPSNLPLLQPLDSEPPEKSNTLLTTMKNKDVPISEHTINRNSNSANLNAIITSFVCDNIRDAIIKQGKMNMLSYLDTFLESQLEDLDVDELIEPEPGTENISFGNIDALGLGNNVNVGGNDDDDDDSDGSEILEKFDPSVLQTGLNNNYESDLDDDEWLFVPEKGTPANLVEQLYLRKLISEATIDWDSPGPTILDLLKGSLFQLEKERRATGELCSSSFLAEMLISGRNDASTLVTEILVGDGEVGIKLDEIEKGCEGKLAFFANPGDLPYDTPGESDGIENGPIQEPQVNALLDIISGDSLKKSLKGIMAEQNGKASTGSTSNSEVEIKKAAVPLDNMNSRMTNDAINSPALSIKTSPPGGPATDFEQYLDNMNDTASNSTMISGVDVDNDDSDMTGSSVDMSTMPFDTGSDNSDDSTPDDLVDGPVGWVSDIDNDASDDSPGVKKETSGGAKKTGTILLDPPVRPPRDDGGQEPPEVIETRNPLDWNDIEHGDLNSFLDLYPNCKVRIVGIKEEDGEKWACVEARLGNGSTALRWVDYDEAVGAASQLPEDDGDSSSNDNFNNQHSTNNSDIDDDDVDDDYSSGDNSGFGPMMM